MSLSQIVRVRLDMAAVDEGFGIKRPDDGNWLSYDSLGAPVSLRLTCIESNYIIAVNHRGVADDLALRCQLYTATGEIVTPPGFTAFSVSDTSRLHTIVRETWRLARALPTEPFRAYELHTRGLPRATEAERLVVQRVGQNLFRDALLSYWNGSCAVTGMVEPRLLRASHIVPWAQCASDEKRLDVYNGLLLAPNLDAAFDAGLITFFDTGAIAISSQLDLISCEALGIHPGLSLRRIADAHQLNLSWHRENIFGPTLQQNNPPY